MMTKAQRKAFVFTLLLLTLLAIFELVTLMIILSHDFLIALLVRGLVAVVVGILFPSYQSVLMTITAREGRAEVMGLAGLVMGTALACGPIISGIILNY